MQHGGASKSLALFSLVDRCTVRDNASITLVVVVVAGAYCTAGHYSTGILLFSLADVPCTTMLL